MGYCTNNPELRRQTESSVVYYTLKLSETMSSTMLDVQCSRWDELLASSVGMRCSEGYYMVHRGDQRCCSDLFYVSSQIPSFFHNLCPYDYIITIAPSLRFLRPLLLQLALSMFFEVRLFFIKLPFAYMGEAHSSEFITKYRTCRRQARECSGEADHHEGMSSDDELPPTEVNEFQKSKGW